MSTCLNCQKELITKNQKKFCGKSCAATHNNKTPKRKRTSLRKCKAEGCLEMLYDNKNGSRSFCFNCISEKKHLRGFDVGESTIEEVVARTGSNRYDRIRSHAHILHRKEKQTTVCENCKYGKHVELCHIVSISSFSKETKVKVVNARENILFLCPNCHWEYDHNLLTTKQIKSRPTGN